MFFAFVEASCPLVSCFVLRHLPAFGAVFARYSACDYHSVDSGFCRYSGVGCLVGYAGCDCYHAVGVLLVAGCCCVIDSPFCASLPCRND